MFGPLTAVLDIIQLSIPAASRRCLHIAPERPFIQPCQLSAKLIPEIVAISKEAETAQGSTCTGVHQ